MKGNVYRSFLGVAGGIFRFTGQREGENGPGGVQEVEIVAHLQRDPGVSSQKWDNWLLFALSCKNKGQSLMAGSH